MAGDERPGTQHEVRIEESQPGQRQQVGRDQDQHAPWPHFQPQNRKTEMICAIASTANAIVIGK